MLSSLQKMAADLSAQAKKSRVFLSMPYIPGITPACMESADIHCFQDEATGLERRDGYFCARDAALSPFDHGNLYGDGVFEGIRIDNRRVLMLREHIDRWLKSASRLNLQFPYSREELAGIIVRLCRETFVGGEISGYLRPVLTRGIGNLGVNPAKCIAPTVYIICSSILLYPRERYETGIDVSIARKIRRNDARHLDPNIKTNNYLNNVLALLETRHTGALETLMLTDDGYVAEATADNIFIAETVNGQNRLTVPDARYALVGMTRNLVIDTARSLGFEIVESDTLLPTDFVGTSREVFITGTACGLMPVCHIDGLPAAQPGYRPLLDRIREALAKRSINDSVSFNIDDDDHALAEYMAQTDCCSVA